MTFTSVYGYYLLGTVSIIYAVVKLCRPGISQEMRTLVAKRHILSVLTFFVTNLYLATSVLLVFNTVARGKVP